jgi:hypothetical protein
MAGFIAYCIIFSDLSSPSLSPPPPLHSLVQSLLHSCWLVAAVNGWRSPSSRFPIGPWPQLPASNGSSPLTGFEVKVIPVSSTHLGPQGLIFVTVKTVAGQLMWGAQFDERMGCCLQLLLALANAEILRSKSCRTHDHILLSQIRDSPSLEG